MKNNKRTISALTSSNELNQLKSSPEKQADGTEYVRSKNGFGFDDPRSFCLTWQGYLEAPDKTQQLSVPKLMATVIRGFINARERKRFSDIFPKDIFVLEDTNGLITYFLHCETSDKTTQDLHKLEEVLGAISVCYDESPNKFEALEKDETLSYPDFLGLIKNIDENTVRILAAHPFVTTEDKKRDHIREMHDKLTRKKHFSLIDCDLYNDLHSSLITFKLKYKELCDDLDFLPEICQMREIIRIARNRVSLYFFSFIV